MATKLLLIEDVADLGRKGEIVSVKSGFAYNYLLPQKFALLADKNALRKQVRLQAERQAKADLDRKESETIAQQLKGETVETTVKVDHEGHMYGSVSALDIVHLIKLKTGIDLDKKMVQLKHAIKETGVLTLPIRLKEGVEIEINLKVIPEQG